MRATYYRGYRLERSGTTYSIYSKEEKITTAGSLSGAKNVIDSWLDAA